MKSGGMGGGMGGGMKSGGMGGGMGGGMNKGGCVVVCVVCESVESCHELAFCLLAFDVFLCTCVRVAQFLSRVCAC